MKGNGPRPGVIAVWLLLAVLVAVIAVVELRSERRTAENWTESRDRMLLPVPVEQLGAVELAHAGMLHRFERDAAGNWFYHGVHNVAEGTHAHQIDPAVSARIGNEEMPNDVRWIRSYVTKHEGGRIGTVCIYQATSPEAIREHARRVGMPADAITPILDTVIVRPDPTNV